MCHLSTKFCENQLSSFFCIILLTNNKRSENITSLAEQGWQVSATMALTGLNHPDKNGFLPMFAVEV